MSRPDLDHIIQSPEAEAFLRMVTRGFYDTSYIGQWMFEVIGREWDEMREWAEGLRNEINPQTCTWSVAIWEWVYGIEPDTSLLLTHRRQRILAKVKEVKPINPEMIRRGVTALAGGAESEVTVNAAAGPYRFEVNLRPAMDAVFSMEQIARYIRRVKPSHLRLYAKYDTPRIEIYTPQCIVLVRINLHWLFPFWEVRCWDGSWDLDGSEYLDASRRYTVRAGLIIDTHGCRSRRTLNGSWNLDGSVPLDADSAVKTEMPKLTLKSGIRLTEQFSYLVHEKTGYAVEFWRQTYLDGSRPLDGSWQLEDSKRQKSGHGAVAVSGIEAAHRESVRGGTVVWSRNPWYLDGSNTFADAKLLNSIYEQEDI